MLTILTFAWHVAYMCAMHTTHDLHTKLTNLELFLTNICVHTRVWGLLIVLIVHEYMDFLSRVLVWKGIGIVAWLDETEKCHILLSHFSTKRRLNYKDICLYFKRNDFYHSRVGWQILLTFPPKKFNLELNLLLFYLTYLLEFNIVFVQRYGIKQFYTFEIHEAQQHGAWPN